MDTRAPSIICGRAKVEEASNARKWKARGRTFSGFSDDNAEFQRNPALSVDYIVVPPRIAYYIECSIRIYDIYLKYVAQEDINTYSIDEVSIDVTHYLATYHMAARDLAMIMIQGVLQTSGITATAGVGTNL